MGGISGVGWDCAVSPPYLPPAYVSESPSLGSGYGWVGGWVGDMRMAGSLLPPLCTPRTAHTHTPAPFAFLPGLPAALAAWDSWEELPTPPSCLYATTAHTCLSPFPSLLCCTHTPGGPFGVPCHMPLREDYLPPSLPCLHTCPLHATYSATILLPTFCCFSHHHSTHLPHLLPTFPAYHTPDLGIFGTSST